MQNRISAILIILICGVAIVTTSGVAAIRPHQISIAFVNDSGQREAKKQFVVLSSEAGQIHLVDGGEFPAESDLEPMSFGAKVDGSIKDTTNATARLDLAIELSEKVSSPEAETQLVVGRLLRIRTDLTAELSKRIDYGPSQYCVLQLD